MLRTLARLAPAVLVCFVALPAVATPPAPPSVQAQHALSLEPTDCVYREGDDLSWAAANLDESKWQPIADWPGIATRTPYYWLRCRFNPSQLSSDVSPAIQVSGDLSYEIYVDGQLAGSFGNLITGAHTVGEVRDFEPGALSSRGHDIQVALRMAFTPETLEIQPMPQLTLGDAGYMRGQYSRQVAADLSKRWVSWVSCGLIGAAGLFFLSLFWFDRSQTYLLWAGLAWLCIADLRLNEFLHYASIPYPSGLEALLYSAQFSVFFSIFLFFRLAGKPVNRFFRSIQVVLFASSVLFLPLPFLPLRLEMELRWLLDVSPWPGAVVQTAWVIGSIAPLFAFWPLHKLRGSQIATACVSLLWMIIEFAYLLSLFPGIYHADRSGGLQLTTLIQQYRTVVILIVVLTLTFLLIQRLRETNRERAMLAGEMLAAQQIQRALVPASLSTLPDLKIDAVFRPAQEVGGDFYRVRILSGGVQRVLIGDVSGKGAAAAMTGAVLLGASEGREADSPSALLHHLNRTLSDVGLSGFATCLCLDIHSNGLVRYANAGHIAPYRAGAECPNEPGLPLGLVLGSIYGETTIELVPGESLTLLTDGVLEATNPITRELFGFDRTAAISTQSAENIATAAQRFGQEDDITVLTLTFAPVEVLRA